MSLVERAVKRLEELGKGGSPDESSAASGNPEALSTIERAMGRVEGTAIEPARDRVKSSAPRQPEVHAGGAHRDADVVDTSERREPTLDDGGGSAGSASGVHQRQSRSPSPAQVLDLDLRRLAAAGFIDVEDPESTIANEFRRIKRPLIRACQGRLAAPVANANRIMVTSSMPGEGKSFVALNLALSMAMERDFSVLLVDADTTRRSVSIQLGISNRTGLLDLVESDRTDPAGAVLRTSVDRLDLLPAGAVRRHATELLASDSMERLVEALASRYQDRILIFDAPPLLGAPEPAVLATHMGQIIVVVEAGRTTHKALANALAAVESCPVVTAVLNKTSSADAGYHYYDATSGAG